MQSLINLIFTQIWEMKRMNMRADNVLLEIIPGYTTGTYIIIDQTSHLEKANSELICQKLTCSLHSYSSFVC